MAETNEKKKRIYGVKDVVDICGLDRNRVFYWSKTLRVIEPEYVTPGRQLFTFRALLDFKLIFELQKIGLSPESIKSIVWVEDDVDTEGGTWTRRWPIWDVFLDNREKYERDGFYLCSREKHVGQNSFIEYFVGTADEVEPIVSREMGRMPVLISSARLINLLSIIREVEEKSGECLE